MRIVSLLPSTTEIAFALGVGADVVGVTFECDHPPAARERTIVSTSTMPEGLDPAAIDDFVAAATARGEDLYRLDAGALAHLDPDLVLTQDLCAVCAIDVDTVGQALDHLGCRADVLTTDPHTIDEIMSSILAIGDAVDRRHQADRLVADLRSRLQAAGRRAHDQARRPRVAVLEWTDPPYAPGHWIPEMIDIAGGECVLGRAGEKSVRITWDDLAASRPDLVVVAPCGYDRAGAAAQAQLLHEAGQVPEGAVTLPVDADAHWARPEPRVVDGIEELAAVISDWREAAGRDAPAPRAPHRSAPNSGAPAPRAPHRSDPGRLPGGAAPPGAQTPVASSP